MAARVIPAEYKPQYSPVGRQMSTQISKEEQYCGQYVPFDGEYCGKPNHLDNDGFYDDKF